MAHRLSRAATIKLLLRVRFTRHDASLPTPGLRSEAEGRAGRRRDAGACSCDLVVRRTCFGSHLLDDYSALFFSQSFPGNVRFYTLGCKFIDHILYSGIIEINKPFAAWLVTELLFAELRPEPSILNVSRLPFRTQSFPPPERESRDDRRPKHITRHIRRLRGRLRQAAPAHAIPQGPVRQSGRPAAAPAGAARERAAAGGGLSLCRHKGRRSHGPGNGPPGGPAQPDRACHQRQLPGAARRPQSCPAPCAP